MAGEPALDKIMTGIGEAWLDGDVGCLIEIDRGADEGYAPEELPAANLIHVRTAFEMHEHGAQLHRATFDIDLIASVDEDSSPAAQLREMEADAVAALYADRTLGGLAQDIILIASGGDEDIRADEGARPLSIEVLFLTPVGNHRTIIGAAGPVP